MGNPKEGVTKASKRGADIGTLNDPERKIGHWGQKATSRRLLNNGEDCPSKRKLHPEAEKLVICTDPRRDFRVKRDKRNKKGRPEFDRSWSYPVAQKCHHYWNTGLKMSGKSPENKKSGRRRKCGAAHHR